MDEQVYIKAPWWFPPSDAEWIDLVGDGEVDSNSDLVTLVSLKLPEGSRGVVRWFGQDIDNEQYINNITWMIKINGGPDKVYGKIRGRLSTILQPSRCLIRIPQGKTISFSVTSDNVNTARCIGRLQGWHWLKREIKGGINQYGDSE